MIFVLPYQQAKYGAKIHEIAGNDQNAGDHNVFEEYFNHLGYDIVDVGASLLSLFISIPNFFAPNAVPTDWLANYYLERNQRVIQKEVVFQQAKAAVIAARAVVHVQALGGAAAV
jgi:hypothetical protein